MIYLDTSVVLAHLLAEDRCPPPSLWEEDLFSSRLLEYETWTRIHALHLASAVFLRAQGESVTLASYDDRLVTAARQLGFQIAVD